MGVCHNIITSPCTPIVIGYFILSMIIVGTLKVIGVLYEAMSISLRMSLTGFGFSLGFYMLICSVPAPMIVLFHQRAKVRRRVCFLVGTAFLSSGLIFASFAQNTCHFAVSLALTGFGLDILDVYLNFALHEQSTANFNLLFCLSSSGCGVAMVLPPLLAEVLREAYGWRGALLIIGGLTANILPCVLKIRDAPENSTCVNEDIAHIGDRVGNVQNLEGYAPLECMEDPVPVGTMNASTSANAVLQGSIDNGNLAIENMHMHQPGESEIQTGLVQHPSGGNANEENDYQNADEWEETAPSASCCEESENSDEISPLNEVPVRPPTNPTRRRFLSALFKTPVHSNTRGDTEHKKTHSNKEEPKKTASKWTDRMKAIIQSSPTYIDPWSNLIFLSCIVFCFVYNGWHSFLVPHALQRGINPYTVIIITSAAGVGNFAGRVSVGILTHRTVSPLALFLILCPINVFALLAYTYVKNISAMTFLSGISAFSIAGRAKLPNLAAKERSSPDQYPTLYAFFKLSVGLGYLLGAYISGIVAQKFSDMDTSMRLLAVVDVLVFFLMLPVKIVNHRQSRDSS